MNSQAYRCVRIHASAELWRVVDWNGQTVMSGSAVSESAARRICDMLNQAYIQGQQSAWQRQA